MWVVPPCLGASIIMFHLAMQQTSSMGALEAGLDWEDAGWEAPAGIRNVFACFNTLHWPHDIKEQNFPFCDLCPSWGFSKIDNTLSLGDTGVFWHAVPCWELAPRHVQGTWARLQGHSPCPNMGQLPGVGHLLHENWDVFDSQLVSWLVFVRAEAVFMFSKRIQI